MKTKRIMIMTVFMTTSVLLGQTIHYQSNKLQKLWEADGLSVPESVFPVTGQKIMYVSNVGSKDPSAKDWTGKVQFIKKTGQKQLLLDSSKDKNLNAADFGYLVGTKTVYVPTFYGNSVVCYQVSGAIK